jgi:hypothetical protein
VDSAIALESDWPATNVFSAAWTTRTASIPDAATRISSCTQVIRPASPRYQEACQILGLKKNHCYEENNFYVSTHFYHYDYTL